MMPHFLGKATPHTPQALPKNSPAVPADVRKAFGLPANGLLDFGLRPICWGTVPNFIVHRNGSAQRFRTSGGKAAGVIHFLGKAHTSHLTSGFVDLRLARLASPTVAKLQLNSCRRLIGAA